MLGSLAKIASRGHCPGHFAAPTPFRLVCSKNSTDIFSDWFWALKRLRAIAHTSEPKDGDSIIRAVWKILLFLSAFYFDLTESVAKAAKTFKTMCQTIGTYFCWMQTACTYITELYKWWFPVRKIISGSYEDCCNGAKSPSVDMVAAHSSICERDYIRALQVVIETKATYGRRVLPRPYLQSSVRLIAIAEKGTT